MIRSRNANSPVTCGAVRTRAGRMAHAVCVLCMYRSAPRDGWRNWCETPAPHIYMCIVLGYKILQAPSMWSSDMLLAASIMLPNSRVFPGMQISYEAGDHIAVYAENSPATVEAAAERLGLPLDTVFTLDFPVGDTQQLSPPFLGAPRRSDTRPWLLAKSRGHLAPASMVHDASFLAECGIAHAGDSRRIQCQEHAR